ADARVLTSSFRINSTGDIAGGFDVGGVFRVRIGGVVALATNAARTVTLVETAEDALAQIDTRLTEIRRLVGDRTGVFLDILA
ncbi:MAG: hypothetical protein HY801_10585, partial [Candidatus Lindowbacteria bacterium]|nr:hypothetical protein [Candidatus Lindowbacteria bacterium]